MTTHSSLTLECLRGEIVDFSSLTKGGGSVFTHPGVTERRECWCCGGLTAFQLIHSFRRLGLFSQHSSHSMKHSLKDRAFYGGHRGVIRKSIDSQQGGLN